MPHMSPAPGLRIFLSTRLCQTTGRQAAACLFSLVLSLANTGGCFAAISDNAPPEGTVVVGSPIKLALDPPGPVSHGSSTILPTDVVPTLLNPERTTFAQNFQMRVLQHLPPRMYLNATVESSFRYETNPFQFPLKRRFLRQLGTPATFRALNSFQQGQVLNAVGLVGNDDLVFRVLPNVTGGLALTPRTRVFCNYFLIRDSLFHDIRLNTVVQSIAGGVAHDFPISTRGNLLTEFQFRELYQSHQQPVFDFLPTMTFSYLLNPRTALFTSALLQLRGKRYFQAPTREIDPFYTLGTLYQRNGWTFSATGTFVQNFREPFKKNAIVPHNNYSFILDFEVARRLMKQLAGVQAFVRAEPIYNFHSNNLAGLAGTDFRLFWGMRMNAAKPALTAVLEQIRDQIEEEEHEFKPPQAVPRQVKPSAFIMPYELNAQCPAVIHDCLPLRLPEEPVLGDPAQGAIAMKILPEYNLPLPGVDLPSRTVRTYEPKQTRVSLREDDSEGCVVDSVENAVKMKFLPKL